MNATSQRFFETCLNFYGWVCLWLKNILFPLSKNLYSLENLTPKTFLNRLNSARPPPQLSNTFTISHIQSLFRYNDPFIRDILWELKYRGDTAIAKLLAWFLQQEIVLIYSTYQRYGLSEPLLLIPLPSSKKRLRERGWNQTFLITEALHAQLKSSDTKHTIDQSFNNACEVRKDILLKNRHTVAQAKLNRKSRFTNLNNVFILDQGKDVAGRTIILFDDVLTTGTTIAEAAKVLKGAGALEVMAITIAH